MATTDSVAGQPLHDLTGFQRDLLIVIDEETEPHGLRIKAVLESKYEEEVNHGRLYPNLDTLAEKGMVRKEQADRRTNAYSLTPRGARELDEHREFVGQA